MDNAISTIPVHKYYYLHNFQSALQWIHDRYQDILQPEETAFINGFSELPAMSQALFVRLIMRKGPWFRYSKLVYDEIPDVLAAAQPLLALGWLREDEPLSLEELFGLYAKPELVTVFAPQGARASMRKSEILALMSAADTAPQYHNEWITDSTERAWKIDIGPLCTRLRLMFFGNLYQTWSEFVLADLGIFNYEAVAFDASCRAFQQGHDVDTYLEINAWRELVNDTPCLEEYLELLKAPVCGNHWLEGRRQKLLYCLGQAYEKQGDLNFAQQVYAASTYPGARHRNIRVLEKLGDCTQALELAQRAIENPESPDEKQKLARMLPRLLRCQGIPAQRRKALSPSIAGLSLHLELLNPEPLLSVELALRHHWHSEHSPVFYVENSLFNALFGLLFWDALFAPLQGAFFHPFQAGPADFGSADFMQRRHALFEKGLNALVDGSYQHMIQSRFIEKQGLLNLFVFWSHLTQDLLDLALICIPPQHLRLVFSRMLCDLKQHRTGFPDLIRFWPEQQSYEMVEAKAPGDKLQDNQILWLEYFVAHNIPVKVCHVTWLKPLATEIA